MKRAITCDKMHRKLAMIDQTSIHLYCKGCKEDHSIAREEINRMWSQFDEQQSKQETSTSEQRVLY
jgi:hypothetical protein